MHVTKITILGAMALGLLAAQPAGWAQDKESGDKDKDKKADTKQEFKRSPVANEITLGAYYLTDDAYRYGKYSGLTDEGGYGLLDFRLEKRPDTDTMDTVRWRLQGWRLGLDSRRLEFSYEDQGKQKFGFDFREIPNYRFSDGLTPYRARAAGQWDLAPDWYVIPGTSNTLGFANLQENLVNLKVDSKRKRFDLSYDRRLNPQWNLDVDWKHEKKSGSRTFGSIFGYTGGNARSVMLAAPIDWTTDNIEAMFEYSSERVQFGLGAYSSFFSNGDNTLTFQNAYGHRNGWADGVEYPDAYGRASLEPDNSYIQFKSYAGMNLSPSTRLTADFSYGKMEQNDALLPWTINPDLLVYEAVPLESLDAELYTTMFNLRLTTQFARSLSLAASYRYDDRDNDTPRAVYPYIGGDSQDQPPAVDGRINLPYSYTRQKADAVLTYRLGGGNRLRAGLEYDDYSRDYQEVSDSDEVTWLVGFNLRGWSTGSVSFDFRGSSRDISNYDGSVPLVDSSVPGTVQPGDYENLPQLRKYFLTDRDRNEYRIRADLAPTEQLNFGLSGSYAHDDYGDGYFGLNDAEVESWSLDAGWHPRETIALTAFYTWEKYDAEQSARSFSNAVGAADPANDWWADTRDRVDTWNVALTFSDVGAGRGWKGIDFGIDYTLSDTRSNIDVTAATLPTAPLPELQSEWRSFSLWGSAEVGEHSLIRLSAENADLNTADWGLDNVVPDTLANVLLLGESAANYDLWLFSASWTYQF